MKNTKVNWMNVKQSELNEMFESVCKEKDRVDELIKTRIGKRNGILELGLAWDMEDKLNVTYDKRCVIEVNGDVIPYTPQGEEREELFKNIDNLNAYISENYNLFWDIMDDKDLTVDKIMMMLKYSIVLDIICGNFGMLCQDV
jgi:hypothetical protein